MPVIDKPLPEIAPEETFLSSAHADLMTQVHQATYSPSPSRRILQDPSLIPIEPSERSKDKSTRRRQSRSPKRRAEHRSLVVAAVAIAEEERQGRHLKSLLRTTGEHLEQEMRRATEATMRANFAERREREVLSRANEAEAKNEELQNEITRLERDMRSYQMQLEASELATERLREDLAEARRETHEIERGERKAQEKVQRYHLIVQDYEKTQRRMQGAADSSYEDGREDGYNEGYDAGFETGRKHGLQEGIKRGRRQGHDQGRSGSQSQNGHNLSVSESVFDLKVGDDGNDNDERQRHERTRRWTEGVQAVRSEVGSQQQDG